MNYLLLRGLGREKRHWLEFPSLLQKRNRHVLMLDLPGFGDQQDVTVPLSINGNTEFLRDQFLEQRPVREPWCLVGISLGGMIALDWVKRYPTDFTHLVAINSSARNLSSAFQRLTPFGMYRIARAGAAKSDRDREVELLKMVSNLKFDDDKTIKQMVQIRKKNPPALSALSRQLAAASRFDCPTKVVPKTLVLASLKDRMVDVRCSKAIAESLKAKTRFHPTAGHELPLDDAKWVAEQIREFAED